MQGIYIIKNKITGRQYVGSTIDSDTRWRRHRNSLDKEIHHSRYLNHAWKKYGAEAFEFLMVEEVTDRHILIEREQWWLDNTDSSYNMNRKAYSCLGYKWTSEQLAKRKITQGGDKHWSRRKKYTDEAKKKMSEAQKNLYASGYKHPRNKQVCQCDMDGNVIKVWESLAQASRGCSVHGSAITQCIKGESKTIGGYKWRLLNPNDRVDCSKSNVRRVPINQYDMQGNFIKTWPSVIEASRSFGKHYNCLAKCLKGIYKHSQGYIWKYANKELP